MAEAVTTMEGWKKWFALRGSVIRQRGVYVCMCNGSGQPVIELENYSDLSYNFQHNQPGTASVTVGVDLEYSERGFFAPPPGSEHDIQIFGELMHDHLKMLLIDTGDVRWFGKIKMAKFTTRNNRFDSVTIEALEYLDVLGEMPAVSDRKAWSETKNEKIKDNIHTLKSPREYTLKLFRSGNQVDGFTVIGKADEAVAKLIQENASLIYRTEGYTGPPFLCRRVETGLDSPEITITLAEDTMANTIKDVLEFANINLFLRVAYPCETLDASVWGRTQVGTVFPVPYIFVSQGEDAKNA
jgi:hypothetical protein